jgi:hypothetical protein
MPGRKRAFSLRRLWRFIVSDEAGLAGYAVGLACLSPMPVPPFPRPATALGCGPGLPRSHPEHLVPHAGPTPVESLLHAGLTPAERLTWAYLSGELGP